MKPVGISKGKFDNSHLWLWLSRTWSFRL